MVVFIHFKVFNFDNLHVFSCSRNMQVNFVDKPQLKIISFLNYKHGYLIHTYDDYDQTKLLSLIIVLFSPPSPLYKTMEETIYLLESALKFICF